MTLRTATSEVASNKPSEVRLPLVDSLKLGEALDHFPFEETQMYSFNSRRSKAEGFIRLQKDQEDPAL